MTAMPIPLDAGQAMCAHPDFLPLVDAAAAKPGGPEAKKMKRVLCRNCPVSTLCLDWAMAHGEIGIWGGTGPKKRTQDGAPSSTIPTTSRWSGPLAIATTPRPKGEALIVVPRARSKADLLLDQLGVRGSVVRRWAYEQGIARTRMGRASYRMVEAWAAAHRDADRG